MNVIKYKETCWNEYEWESRNKIKIKCDTIINENTS